MKLWMNDTDTFVARDAAHAAKLHEALVGGDGAPPYDTDEYGEWKEDKRPHEMLLTIMTEEGVRTSETKTIGEWIASTLAERPDGGMLCTTEW